jgi:hypothetical protein
MGLKKTGKMSTTHSFNFATADFVGFQRLKKQINVLALKITKNNTLHAIFTVPRFKVGLVNAA